MFMIRKRTCGTYAYNLCGLGAVAKAEGDKPKRAERAEARRAVIETALAMSRSGLSPGRSGNVSCRWKSGMLITPTGMAYEEIRPRDIVFVTAKGNVPDENTG